MPIVPDFDAGFISDNIVRGLEACNEKTIIRLKEQHYLNLPRTRPQLDYRALLYTSLDAYAKASKLPMCYFFYGTLTPPVPMYTPFDAIVIAMLNAMSEKQLLAMKQAVFLYWDNPFMRCTEIEPDPRFRFLLTRRVHGELRMENVPTYKHFENDISPILRKYSRCCSKRYAYCFPTDLYPDLATFAGVSLHWIMNIQKNPLFCNSQLADELFDYYTLLQPEQWQDFRELAMTFLSGDLSHYIYLSHYI